MAEARDLCKVTKRHLMVAGGIRSMDEVAELDAMGIDAIVGMASTRGLWRCDERQNPPQRHEGTKKIKKGLVVATPTFQPIPDDLNELSRVVVDCALKVHKALGPGLLESSYRQCLVHELHRQNLRVQTEVPLPIRYEGIVLESGYRIDIMVNDTIVVELKAIDDLLAIHHAQLLSYLKHSGKRLGLLINFNCVLLKNGIRRVINN